MKIGLRTLKTAIGATLAILIATWFNLDYAVSAGLITVLSIQNTKKSSFAVAIQRLLSAVIGLSIAACAFLMIGFNAFSFGVFLLLFIPLSVRLKLTDGIMVSSVLVTHILVEQSLSLYWFQNELLLMIVGAGIGILLNLYMPKLEESLRLEQKKIEANMRQILFSMAQSLRGEAPYTDSAVRMSDLKASLQRMQEKASRNLDNTFTKEAHYYVQYADMRLVQYRILKQMKRHLIATEISVEQAEELAAITEKTALQLEENNPAETLVMEITELVRRFRKSQLPATRMEFEKRAILFQFMNDLRYFIETKRDFYSEFGLKKSLGKSNLL